MIITDNFVLLAFPKTGTSYTTAALRSIHARRSLKGRLVPRRWQKRDFPRPGYSEHRIIQPPAPPYNKERSSRHGAYSDIPLEHRDKTIASIARNPFTRYTSSYLYLTRMRKNLRPVADIEILQGHYPGYPDMEFPDFYDMLHRFDIPNHLHGIQPVIELGAQTVKFINFYFRDPKSVLAKIDKAYIEEKGYLEDMADIFFMHQESLRDEFVQFLRKMGYSEQECLLAQDLRQQNVARRDKKESDLSHFYNEQLRETVLQRDALIFSLFPEYAQPW
mgnify:CR=1 FL=1